MKFISSSYDKENHISTVVMQHLGKKFTGTAKLSAEDPTPASEFTGCDYAEIKATLKALKYERKLAKQKADEALDFVKSCTCYKDFDQKDPNVKLMYRQLNKRVQRVNDITDEINYMLRDFERRKIQRKVLYEKINVINKSKEDNS